MSSAYQDVLRIAASLTAAEQLRLISDIAERLRLRGDGHGATSILELRGLGKEIWQGVDAQEYVDRERSSWGG